MRGRRTLYSGCKRTHGQHYQNVLTPDGLSISMVGPFVGSRADITMWHESHLEARHSSPLSHNSPTVVIFSCSVTKAIEVRVLWWSLSLQLLPMMRGPSTST